MNKKDICVIIPVYKEILNDFEIQSVNQCINILLDYSLYFVCPQGLNIDFYRENFSEIDNFTFFDKVYFQGLKGYNRLMLCPSFYKAFNHFEYLLVYQTDCYVFRDELLDWANKDFDYIGGIWFENFVEDPNLGAKLWYPGNGGLSLRNIKSINEFLTDKKPIKGFKQLICDIKTSYKRGENIFVKKIFLLPLNIFGYHNNHKYQAEKYTFNEDFFFVEACSKYNKLKLPEVEDAISFSWDRCPSFLYEKLGRFPFACHAWFREDFPYEGNREFWSNYIKTK